MSTVKKTTRTQRNSRVARKTTPSVKRKSVRTSSITSLENGIKILKYAIKNKVSLSAASNASEKGKNYISDIKARLEENYRSKNISRDLYTTFKNLNKEYQKAVK